MLLVWVAMLSASPKLHKNPKLAAFMHTLNASTPVMEDTPWEP